MKTKLYVLLSALDPIARETAVSRVAAILFVSPSLVRAQIKEVKAAKALGDDEGEGPDLSVALKNLCFDGAAYWRLELDGRYGRIGREDVLLELRRLGFPAKKPFGESISPVEEALHHLQTNERVVYAAPLCGRSAGKYVENGTSLLVTDSPTILVARGGDPAHLVAFFQNLLGRAADDPDWLVQYHTLLAWLKRARSALHNPGQHLPGQLLALVGPADCGKTLAQTLITQMLGGRQADPALWLTGKSQFNDGIWGAEHWAASDSNIEDTVAARKTLRDRIKEATANESLGCHRKHRPEITLRPIARITLSANDDADSSFVLPALDDSIRDKLIYLKCRMPPTPFPTTTEEQAKAFYFQLTNSIPAFLHYVESFSVPEEMISGRFGVREFHHPEIVGLLMGTNSDSDLADALADWLDAKSEDYVGSAVKLYGGLTSLPDDPFKRICGSPTKLGQALRRLARTADWKERITSEDIRLPPNNRRQTRWTIRRQPGVG